jgi:hypothetical protein
MIMSVEDYEHQLKIEISENEERKAFTYSERMDYAKQLERILHMFVHCQNQKPYRRYLEFLLSVPVLGP